MRKSQAERQQLSGAFDVGARSDLKAEEQRQLMALFESPESLKAERAFLQSTQRKLAAPLGLPEAEFQAWWKAVAAALENGHLPAKAVMPWMASVQARAQQRRVERVLFAAGVDVLQNSPAQLAKYRDPATGAPLQYVPTPGGFELRAKDEAKGKPVTLAFPAARAPAPREP